MKSAAAACVVGLMLLVGACGGDDDTESVTEATDTPLATATQPPAESTPEQPADETPASTDEPTTTIPGLTGIATSPTAPGPQPMLEWVAVDGAASYALAVLDGAGTPYWAWTGDATSVRFGAAAGDGGGQTAQVVESMTWTVMAFDDLGELVARSEPGLVEP